MEEIPADSQPELELPEELAIPERLEGSREGLDAILKYWLNELAEVDRMSAEGVEMEQYIAYRKMEVHAEIDKVIGLLDILFHDEVSYGARIEWLASHRQEG